MCWVYIILSTFVYAMCFSCVWCSCNLSAQSFVSLLCLWFILSLVSVYLFLLLFLYFLFFVLRLPPPLLLFMCMLFPRISILNFVLVLLCAFEFSLNARCPFCFFFFYLSLLLLLCVFLFVVCVRLAVSWLTIVQCVVNKKRCIDYFSVCRTRPEILPNDACSVLSNS